MKVGWSPGSLNQTPQALAACERLVHTCALPVCEPNRMSKGGSASILSGFADCYNGDLLWPSDKSATHMRLGEGTHARRHKVMMK